MMSPLRRGRRLGFNLGVGAARRLLVLMAVVLAIGLYLQRHPHLYEHELEREQRQVGVGARCLQHRLQRKSDALSLAVLPPTRQLLRLRERLRGQKRRRGSLRSTATKQRFVHSSEACPR